MGPSTCQRCRQFPGHEASYDIAGWPGRGARPLPPTPRKGRAGVRVTPARTSRRRPEEAVILVDRLRELFPEASRRSLKQWLERGRVEVNGRVVREPRTTVEPADRVALGRHGLVPFPPALGLVYEDADLIVIDKPPGLLTIATERDRERTAYRLLGDCLQARRPSRRPFIVHRLDRETSGLLIFAKSLRAKRHLQAQFETRRVERVYVAVVEGRVREERGTLSSRLVQDRGRSGPREPIRPLPPSVPAREPSRLRAPREWPSDALRERSAR